MPEPRDLNGANVLIAGGSGVLGRELSKRLHGSGARVALAGRDQTHLDSHASDVGGAPTFQFDVRSPRQISEMVESVVASLGGLDGVINAIGVVAFGPLAEMSDDALDELIDVNLTGPLRLTRAAIPHLDNGFLVNITGIVAESPTSGLTAYSASKAGLSAASKALTRELRWHGITVLDARPGHTETGLANRPIEGTAPRMPEGMDPAAVAGRIVEGIRNGDRELASSDFA